ncbi:MAG TPA: hypothetical protein DE147_03510 [Gammaproteobacteria bacterium]|nr:hypothetical protein [Gammaproteobacteria bacterium]
MVIPPLAPCPSLYLPTGTQQRGFSLLELLLVLALLTNLLWFAVPRYSPAGAWAQCRHAARTARLCADPARAGTGSRANY